MSEVKVSELSEASSVNDEDLVMIVQNNINKKVKKETLFEETEEAINEVANRIVTTGSYTTTDAIPSKEPTSINITLPVDLELSNDNYIILATADGSANYGDWITVTRTRKSAIDNNRIGITLFNIGDGPTTGNIVIKYVIIKK